MKIEYKPVAVQDECIGGTKTDPRLWVFVKMEGIGKKVHHKFEVMEFPNALYLDKWLQETKMPVVSEKELRTSIGHQARLLAEASSRKQI